MTATNAAAAAASAAAAAAAAACVRCGDRDDRTHIDVTCPRHEQRRCVEPAQHTSVLSGANVDAAATAATAAATIVVVVVGNVTCRVFARRNSGSIIVSVRCVHHR
jgi:hypothetical protein